MLRLGACLGVLVHIIEPCGFILSDRRLRRSGMDYLDTAAMVRHASWHEFQQTKLTGERYVLLTPDSPHAYIHFSFQKDDVLIVGSESCGVPKDIHASMDARIKIPMCPGHRSKGLHPPTGSDPAICPRQILGTYDDHDYGWY